MKMYENWIEDDIEIKIWQDINKNIDKMNEKFKMALDFYAYKDKRWE